MDGKGIAGSTGNVVRSGDIFKADAHRQEAVFDVGIGEATAFDVSALEGQSGMSVSSSENDRMVRIDESPCSLGKGERKE